VRLLFVCSAEEGPTMQVKIVHLPVQLTEDELRSKGQQQAAAMIEFSALESEKRDITADLGARLKAKRRELDRLAVEVRTGVESRAVECHLVPVWASHTVVTMRRDTGEQVETRPMSAAERQLELRAVSGEGARLSLVDDEDDELDADNDNDEPH